MAFGALGAWEDVEGNREGETACSPFGSAEESIENCEESDVNGEQFSVCHSSHLSLRLRGSVSENPNIRGNILFYIPLVLCTFEIKDTALKTSASLWNIKFY